MIGALLRNGRLTDFQAVGEKGMIAFDVAAQIREVLRLRQQAHIANCLAIPQCNGNGEVAWYAPCPGRVTSWAMADEAQRQQALSILERVVDDAQALSLRCLESDTVAQQRFGMLLSKALQFPTENHLYLVDEQPVITFWGFVRINEPLCESVLERLHPTEIPPKEPLSDQEPQLVIASQPSGLEFYNAVAQGELLDDNEVDSDLITTALERNKLVTSRESVRSVISPEPEYQTFPAPEKVIEPLQDSTSVLAEPQSVTRHRKRWPLAGAVITIAIVTAVVLPERLIKEFPEASGTIQPVATVPVVEATPYHPLLRLHARLPLIKATVIPAPVPKDALRMDADQVYAGQTQFLDGTWRISVKGAPADKQYASLRYQIKDNKGHARLVLDNGAICKAELFSGLHKNGELMIKSRGQAHCSDGSHFLLPTFSCRMGDGPAAECRALYDENLAIPALFRKVVG